MKRKLLILLLFVSALPLCTYAENEVVIFCKNLHHKHLALFKMNGEVLFAMHDPYGAKADYKPSKDERRFDYYGSSYRVCKLQTEGKTVFELEYNYMPNENVVTMCGEIQFRLKDGDIHYLKMKAKGLNDFRLVEIDKKEAEKLMKKYIKLVDYVEE